MAAFNHDCPRTHVQFTYTEKGIKVYIYVKICMDVYIYLHISTWIYLYMDGWVCMHTLCVQISRNHVLSRDVALYV